MSSAALVNQAIALHRAGRSGEAETLYLQAAAADPRDFASRCMLGVLRLEQGRYEEAVTALAAAVALDPRPPQGHANLGNALMRVERYEEAEASFSRALERAPRDAALLCNRGAALVKLYRIEEALASYDAALALRPDLAAAHYNAGNALSLIGRHDEAKIRYDAALAAQPGYLKALYNRGATQIMTKHYAGAAVDFQTVLAHQPDHADAFIGLAQSAAHSADWSRREEFETGMRALILERNIAVSPLTVAVHFGDPILQLVNARLHAQTIAAAPAPPLPRYAHDKIRLAYVSGDFRDHPVARVAVDLFERHDRGAFEVFGFSLRPSDGSALAQRTAAAFDQFHDVSLRTDAEIAALMRALEIDIAIDLGGHTSDARPGVFALRAAPVQVNFLGYPGTMGATYIDYILADAIVAANPDHFSERVSRLPRCYLPHDSKRPRPRQGPSRADAGLPETGFVFCCFNHAFKITPAVFGVWMRLLRAIEGAVLWLSESNPEATANLRKAAVQSGVDPARIIFAPRVPREEDHLARHRCADLFLDTAPYNAHSTAADALWMGVPVVTVLGETFAGRVAASLCEEAGVPELIATDLAGYEALALSLAREPERLAALKRKLESDLSLFDSDLYRRAIEVAYRAM